MNQYNFHSWLNGTIGAGKHDWFIPLASQQYVWPFMKDYVPFKAPSLHMYAHDPVLNPSGFSRIDPLLP